MHLVYVYMYASLTPSEIVLVSWWIRYMWDQWCSKFQVVKAQTSKAVTDSWAPKTVMVSTDRHATSNSSSKAFGLEAKKAQHWTWLAHLRHLPWPCESTEQQRWAEYSKGWVLIIQPVANSHWLLKQNSEAAASRKYVVSQTGPRGKTSTTTNTHSWDFWAAYNDSW